MGVKTGHWMAAVAALSCAWGAMGQQVEPRRPLCGVAEADRELLLARAEAAARLLGYVRFFHANDGVWKSDWDALSVRLMDEALSAGDDEDLGARLNGVLGRVAPLVRVYREGGEPPARVPETPSEGASAAFVAVWEHVGLRIGEKPQGAWYRSDRMGVSLADPKAFERAPDPRTEIDEALGSGLRVAMPVSVLVDSKVKSMPQGEAYRGEEGTWGYTRCSARLAAAATAWGALRHFSPIGNLHEADWDGGLREALALAYRHEDGLREGVRRLLARAGDGQGDVRMEGERRWRVGASFAWAEGRVFVERVDSEDVGLAVGDEILEARGGAIEVRVREALTRSAGATEEARRARALDVLCEGQEGERVAWVVLRRGERVEVETGTVERTPAGFESRVLESGVRVVRVGEARGDELIEAMNRLSGARGVVIDARNADAGVARSLGWLVTGVFVAAPEWSAVVMLPEWNSVRWMDETGELGPKGPRMGGAVALLVDARTVGAAEIASVAVKGLRLGDLVGERTGGSAGRVVDARLPGGMWLRFTGTMARLYDGSAVNGVGVEPTVVVERTAEGMAAGRDEAMERAVRLVLEKSGGAPRE